MGRLQKIGLFSVYAIVGVTLLWLWKDRTIFYDVEREHLHQMHISVIPHDISFAGEEVHFKNPTSYQLFYKEIKLNARKNSSTRLIRKQARIILPNIEKTLKKQGVPDDFKYIAIVESNLRNDVVSPQGAAGVWQLTPPTARAMGLIVNDSIDDRLNIEKSTKAACKLIKMGKAKFGNWTSAAAAYNRGMGGLERAMIKQGADSYYDLNLNPETAKYIYKILAFKILITQKRADKIK